MDLPVGVFGRGEWLKPYTSQSTYAELASQWRQSAWRF